MRLDLCGLTYKLLSKSLQDETESDIQVLRHLCNKLLHYSNPSDALRDYQGVKNIYLQTYTRWFPTGERARPRAVEVIGHFTPNLHETLKSAWESYLPQRLKKEHMRIDMTDLTLHSSMKVLIDPVVLTTAMHQILDNVDKLAVQDALVSILCKVRLPEQGAESTDGTLKIATDQVGIVVSNTGTPRPQLNQMKLRGLYSVKSRLSEYGGGLDYTVPVPETEWSFEVVMKLPVWTEEEK